MTPVPLLKNFLSFSCSLAMFGLSYKVWDSVSPVSLALEEN
jgi:hypothetical protein